MRVFLPWFQHTAARRRLLEDNKDLRIQEMFQHTAARRRLHGGRFQPLPELGVSTHSRAEAAA